MIYLVKEDIDQSDLFEILLDKCQVPYEAIQGRNALYPPPYLIVDGVPLDTIHSINYLYALCEGVTD